MIVVMVMVTTMGMMTWWENDVDDDYALHRLDGGIACQHCSPNAQKQLVSVDDYDLMSLNLAYVCNNFVYYLALLNQLE